jgi:hypothetical protein
LGAERAEHQLLFNLIGDPLLRLRNPGLVRVEVAGRAEPGERLKVWGTTPVRGEATVELVVRRDRFTCDAPLRTEYPETAEELAAFQQVYDRVNDRRLASVKLTVASASFQTWLPLPEDAQGPCHVCVFVKGTEDFALGSADIELTTARGAEPRTR